MVFRGKHMNRKITAAVLAACMLLAFTACDKTGTGASEIHSQATFGTTADPAQASNITPNFLEETFDEVMLAADTGSTYSFKYDTDIFAYTGQGGNFYLVGSDATKCFLHIIVQDQAAESFENSKNTYKDSITKEFSLDSGRNAFIYKTADANNIHIIIEGKGIIQSGNGTISVYVGSFESWPYSTEQIAVLVDRGFQA